MWQKRRTVPRRQDLEADRSVEDLRHGGRKERVLVVGTQLSGRGPSTASVGGRKVEAATPSIRTEGKEERELALKRCVCIDRTASPPHL